jgi:hypothetical protein
MSFEQPSSILPPDVRAALDRGQKIEAIKLMRERTGLGLKEAKDAVETYRPATASSHAPGEVHGSGKQWWWIALTVVIAVVFGYFIRGGA